MIPVNGSFSMSDANVELGYSSTTSTSVTARLTEMGETSNPDTMEEMRGYDLDWDDGSQGWIQGIGRSNPNPPSASSTNYFYIKPHNYSVVHSYSTTIYWQTTINGTRHAFGNFSTGTISWGSDGTEQHVDTMYSNEVSSGDTIKIQARTDTSNSWIDIYTGLATS